MDLDQLQRPLLDYRFGKNAAECLERYPIPACKGQILVDIGCGRERWSITPARAGFHPIGIDVHIDALAAATQVLRQLGIQADHVCGNVEHLPLRSASVDMLFSYSVLQRLDRGKVGGFFREAAQVLKARGICRVQLPNASRLYNALRQARRSFRGARPGTFERANWSQVRIREAIASAGIKNV